MKFYMIRLFFIKHSDNKSLLGCANNILLLMMTVALVIYVNHVNQFQNKTQILPS